MGVCAFGGQRPSEGTTALLRASAVLLRTRYHQGARHWTANRKPRRARRAGRGEIFTRPGAFSDPSRNDRRRYWRPARLPGRCWRVRRWRGKWPVPCCTPCPAHRAQAVRDAGRRERAERLAGRKLRLADGKCNYFSFETAANLRRRRRPDNGSRITARANPPTRSAGGTARSRRSGSRGWISCGSRGPRPWRPGTRRRRRWHGSSPPSARPRWPGRAGR